MSGLLGNPMDPFSWVRTGLRALGNAAADDGGLVGPGGVGRSDYAPDGQRRNGRQTVAQQNRAYRQRRTNASNAGVRARAIRLAKQAYGANYGTQPGAPGSAGVFGGGTPTFPPPADAAPVPTPNGGPPPGPGGPGNNGAAGAAPAYDMYDQAGYDAVDRVNGVYGDAMSRLNTLHSQDVASRQATQQALNGDLMRRYAELQGTVAHGNADMAAQGFSSAPTAAAGNLQLQALQNAASNHDEYARRLAQVNDLNASDRAASIAQSQAAVQAGIWGDVASQRLAAAQAAAKASGGGGGGGGGRSGGMSLTSAWPLALKMYEAQHPSDPTAGYMNMVNSTAFDKNQNRRLWQTQQKLQNQASPMALLAALNRGPKGHKNSRQAAYLQSLVSPYQQAAQGAGKSAQQPSYDALAPYLQMLMGG